jgi:regulatory protein
MDEFEINYNRALRFLSYRPRSEKEIKDYLFKKSLYTKASEEQKKEIESITNSIIEKLKEQRFLNDEEFARMWVQSRVRAKPRASRVIKRELQIKGIDKEKIEELFAGNENEIPSDFQMAFTLAQKRLKKYTNLPKQEFFEKMGRFLASRGFTYDIIKEVIAEITNNRSE